jgi:hypothetical protein
MCFCCIHATEIASAHLQYFSELKTIHEVETTERRVLLKLINKKKPILFTCVSNKVEVDVAKIITYITLLQGKGGHSYSSIGPIE